MKQFSILAALVFATFLWGQVAVHSNLKSDLIFLSSDDLQGRSAGTLENQIAATYIAARLESMGLEPCMGDSFFLPFDWAEGRKMVQTINNVCAMKKGKQDDKILVSAHFDHIGVQAEQQGVDHIFNGADDNASGVAAVLALAERFSKVETDKTLWFIGFNAEEKGLYGSKKMAEQMKEKNLLSSVKLMFNFEMLGTVSEFGEGQVFITGDDKSNLDEMMNENAKEGFKVFPDPYKKYKLFYRSDNAPFAEQGVVAHSFSTVDMKVAKHYHKAGDDMSVIDFDNLQRVVNSLGDAVAEFANGKQQPKYNKNK